MNETGESYIKLQPFNQEEHTKHSNAEKRKQQTLYYKSSVKLCPIPQMTPKQKMMIENQQYIDGMKRKGINDFK